MASQAEVARLVARLEADIRDFDRDMKKATKRLDQFEKESKQADKAARKVGDSTDGVGAKMKKLGKVVAAAYATKVVLDFARASVGAAVDLNESINAVEVTFGDAAEGVKALGEQSAESLGLANSEFNSLAVQFSAFTEKIAGAEGRDVVAVLEELTGRAADFASVMNIEVADAARLFQSGLAGETEALRKYGIDLSAAAVNARAMEMGLAGSTSALTEQDKILARYNLLMEQTAKTQGDFANTSDDLANKTRIFNAKLEDAKAQIGEALIPVMEELLDVAMDLLPAFTDWAEGIAGMVESLGPLIEGIGWVITKFFELGNAASDAATEFRNPASGMGAMLTELVTKPPWTTLINNFKRLKSVIDGTFEGNRQFQRAMREIGENAKSNSKQVKAFNDGLQRTIKTGGLTADRLDELVRATDFYDNQLKDTLVSQLEWARETEQSTDQIRVLEDGLSDLIDSLGLTEEEVNALRDEFGLASREISDADMWMNRFRVSAEETEEAVVELTDAEKEAAKETADFEKAMKDLTGQSDETFSSMAGDIESFLTGFEELPDRADVSMEQFEANFRARAAEMALFWETLSVLAARGLDALVDELIAQGPGAVGVAQEYVNDPIAANLMNAFIEGSESGILEMMALIQGFIAPPVFVDVVPRLTPADFEAPYVAPPAQKLPTTRGGIPALAGGGTALAGQPYIVGERGPELFTPGRTGTVTPNDALGRSLTVNQTFERVEGDNLTEDIETGNLMLLLTEKAEG